jgi:antitoxin FitA
VARTRMYCACMPHVQIRDVPDEVHQALVRRAEQAGQSLQQYLAAQLTLLAETPTLDEVLDRIEKRQKGSLTGRDALAALAAERARR